MVDKICSHCGTTVLVHLQYCPGCLRAVETKPKEDGGKVAPGGIDGVAMSEQRAKSNGAILGQIYSTWSNIGSSLVAIDESRSTRDSYTKNDPRFGYKAPKGMATMSLSEGYTRVVCPKCLKPHRASIELLPSALVTCQACRHEFPGSFAAEFRKGADLECFRCGVTTFCVTGLKITECPNCKVSKKRIVIDPEKMKAIVFSAAVGAVLLVMFAHAVVTNTTPQFLTWLCVGSACTFVGFITMVALGF